MPVIGMDSRGRSVRPLTSWGRARDGAVLRSDWSMPLIHVSALMENDMEATIAS